MELRGKLGLVIFFNHVGSRDQPQVARPEGLSLRSLLNHLAGPEPGFFTWVLRLKLRFLYFGKHFTE